MLEYGIPFPTSPSKPKWSEVEKTTLKSFAVGEVGAEEAFEYLTKEMDKNLSKEK